MADRGPDLGTHVLSAAQQGLFEAYSGYPWDGHSRDGEFVTDRPFGDRKWAHSPWDFRFTVRGTDLFMELSHRMTNNRPCGYDAAGQPLSDECVEAVYPFYF